MVNDRSRLGERFFGPNIRPLRPANPRPPARCAQTEPMNAMVRATIRQALPTIHQALPTNPTKHYPLSH